MPTPGRIPRPTLVESAYVIVVAAVATLGFTTESTPAILLAALLALPASLVAVPAYYGVYGLLALVPGANPSSNTGVATCAPHRPCQVSETGDLAAWFTVATDIAGILALTAAAMLTVAVLRYVIAARRAARAPASTRPGS